MTDSPEKISDAFEVAGREPETTFKYGWCVTDPAKHNPHAIRADWPRADYFRDEPYVAQVQKMLKRMGLPWPEKEEIFRGTNHDLLFLSSHGVVIRIGPLNVIDMVNPAILQPLGWLEDRNVMIGLKGDYHTAPVRHAPLAVVIYPGIELSGGSSDSSEVGARLSETGHKAIDVEPRNIGNIQVLGERQQEWPVSLLLDIDNAFSGTTDELLQHRIEKMSATEEFLTNKADIMAHVIESMFSAVKDIKYRIQAFRAHQPLRQLFWDAFKDINNPDTFMRNHFWEACARAVNNPQSMQMPVWKAVTNREGEVQFFRQEICAPSVVLYRPWTGAEADKVIQPLKVDPAIKAAVANAHAQMKEADLPRVASLNHTM